MQHCRQLVLFLGCIFLGTSAWGQEQGVEPKAPPTGGTANLPQITLQLLDGLRKTPGCLGVEIAGTLSGKQVIFAFFENKQAASSWYYSPAHQNMMDMLDPDRDKNKKPMRKIPDGVPILAVASISFKGKPALPDLKIPFSQISIEMYTPLSSGLYVGGAFAPESFLKLVREKSLSAGDK